MPAIHIERSIDINKKIDEVYKSLLDFNDWLYWSPWLIMEKEAKTVVSEDGRYYEWKGDRIGEGNMTIEREEENKTIDYDLTFLKPWKSKAKVRFKLVENKNHTNIVWMMDSSLPFFMFWMKKSMEAYVGMDYERGLRLLKDFLEKGKIDSTIKVLGEYEFSETNYVGLRSLCDIDELSTNMGNDFGTLEEFKKNYPDVKTEKTFTIYEKWDIKKKQAAYIACLSVDRVPLDLDSKFITGNIPSTKIFTLRHTGSYKHLGNAWATMMNFEQSKKITSNKKIYPFEHYVSDPREVKEKDLITDVIFAIK